MTEPKKTPAAPGPAPEARGSVQAPATPESRAASPATAQSSQSKSQPKTQPAAQPGSAPAGSAPASPGPARMMPATSGGFGHVVAHSVRSPQAGPTPAAAAPRAEAAKTVAAPVIPAAPTTAAPKVEAAPVPAVAARKPAVAPKPGDFEMWFKGLGTVPLWEGYRTMGLYGSDGIKATFEAGTILARSVERFAQEMAALAGEEMSAGAEAVESLADCASLQALFAKQSALVRENLDRWTMQAEKLSSISVTLAKETMEPIAKRLHAATDNMLRSFGQLH